MKRLHTYLWMLLAMLPFILLRDFMPNHELRYLSIVDEALRDGTFFTFTLDGQPYADKPPFYFWLLMLSKWLTGGYPMWLLSLFSLLPGLVTVYVMDRWAGLEADERLRSTGRWMMLTCGLFLGLMLYLRMDMLMCMFIVLSLHTFYRLWSGHSVHPGRDRWLFPFYVFMALFSKGPVGILVPLLGTTVFLIAKRDLRSCGRYWGWRTWSVLLGGCVLWFGSVFLEGGTAYLDNLLFHQTVDRAVSSFHHQHPFYYYFGTVWYSLAPWSLLVVGVFLTALCRRWVKTDLQRFFFIIAGTTFVMLSCISSKIQIYLLPAFPFFVYGALLFLPRCERSRWTKVAVVLPAVVFVAALPVLLVLAQREKTAFLGSAWLLACAGILAATGLISLYLQARRNSVQPSIRTLAIGLLLGLFIGGWDMPELNKQIGYGHVCEKGMELARECGSGELYTWKLGRTEGIEKYLGHKPPEMSPDEAKATGKHGFVYLTRTKLADELAAAFPGATIYEVGKYAAIVVK